MGRKGRMAHCLLTLAFIYGCSGAMYEPKETVSISFRFEEDRFRSFPCDEEVMNDINILIFDQDGDLHESLFSTDMGKDIVTDLPAGKTFDLFVCANLGYEVSVPVVDMIYGLTYRLTSPDGYLNGLPMSLAIKGLEVSKDTLMTLNLERLAAKVCIRFDRSGLDSDTEIDVRKILIGNCPKNAALFQENGISQATDIFEDYCLTGESDPYCLEDGEEPVSLYILENIQDSRHEFPTYIEMELGYRSDSLYTTDRNLIYRFHIGDGKTPYEVQRNCLYNITVCPTGDGISDEDWKIEKSGLNTYVQEILLSSENITLDYLGDTETIDTEILPHHASNKALIWESSDESVAEVSTDGKVTACGEGGCLISCHSRDGSGVVAGCIVNCLFAPPHFVQHPQDGYINGHIGESFHLWCEVFPPNAPFDVGKEYLEDDRENGIYDYIIDDDGHGVTITLTGAGSGLIYMEAGAPVNDAALFVIEVANPENP